MKAYFLFSLLMLALCSSMSAIQVQGQRQSVNQSSKDTPQAITRISDDKAPIGWSRYNLKYGDGDALSILLPGQQPEERTETENLPSNIKVTTHFVNAVAESGSVYGALCIELSPPRADYSTESFKAEMCNAFSNSFIEGFKQSLSNNGLSGKVTPLETRKIKVSGLDALEQEASVGSMLWGARMAFSGTHAYMALALTKSNTLTKESTDFFNSFSIGSDNH